MKLSEANLYFSKPGSAGQAFSEHGEEQVMNEMRDILVQYFTGGKQIQDRQQYDEMANRVRMLMQKFNKKIEHDLRVSSPSR